MAQSERQGNERRLGVETELRRRAGHIGYSTVFFTLRVKYCWGRTEATEISWASGKLEKKCSDDRQGTKHWGADNWKLFKRRIASIVGAPTLQDMEGVPGHCHQLHGDRAGEFAIYLWGQFRLTFEPDHDPVPTLDDGGIDRARVTKIVIKEVVDYHGD